MTRPDIGRPLEVLLVEDNPGDVRLAREAFRECPVRSRVSVVEDGEEALRFLRREGPHAQAPRPDLVLLDLNLPRLDGREVLAAVRTDEALRRIPVVVFTTSDAQRDIRTTYDLHANCFVSKPLVLDQFLRVMKGILEFWLLTAELPEP